jgi:hypothetical protein
MASQLTRIYLVLFIIGIGSVAASNFDPNRVHVVDVFKNNILFRGNEPTRNTTFIYDELTARLRLIAQKEANITLDDFYLVGMSKLLI